jgi:hypothetical protein
LSPAECIGDRRFQTGVGLLVLAGVVSIVGSHFFDAFVADRLPWYVFINTILGFVFFLIFKGAKVGRKVEARFMLAKYMFVGAMSAVIFMIALAETAALSYNIEGRDWCVEDDFWDRCYPPNEELQNAADEYFTLTFQIFMFVGLGVVMLIIYHSIKERWLI